MNTETFHAQLDAWAEGNLSPSEINALQSWMNDHPEVIQEMEDRQLVSELMEFSIAQDLRKQFTETPVRSHSPIIPLKRIAAIAAIGIILVVADAFLFASLGSWDHSEIVADASNMVAIPSTGSVRGDLPGNAAAYHTAVLLIEDGQIDQAVSQLMDSLAVHPESSDLNYLIAYSAFRQKDYAKALARFEQINPNNTFSFADDLRWNNILCKMHLDYPTEEIRSDLSEVMHDPTSDHRQQAEDLDEKLSSIWYKLANLLP